MPPHPSPLPAGEREGVRGKSKISKVRIIINNLLIKNNPFFVSILNF